MGASEKDQISDLIEKLAAARSAELVEEATANGYRQAMDDIFLALKPVFGRVHLEVRLKWLKDAELETVPLEDLHFTVRIYNCLKRAGIHNLLQLSRMTYKDMLDIRNLGTKAIQDIQAILEERGLSIIDFPADARPNLGEFDD